MGGRLSACFLAALLMTAAPAIAGTTGSLSGTVVSKDSGAPLVGVTVIAASPTQTASTITDAHGSFAFLSLGPDTYTVSFAKPGYDAISQPGETIFADQTSTLSASLTKALRTIATVRTQSAGSLVRTGTTSDVYSVNASGQAAARALGGSGSLDQAYSAIASVPGVSIPTGQQGWYQSVFIRGGDYDQVAYEFDGIPILRESDGAPITTLSILGQQEVQVYTGGTPATSDSPGLAGYINQVIKTGTYPGYGTAVLGVGGPSFYHKVSIEAGGATPDRRFSYYIGFSGANTTYRYGDQFNNVSNPLYFYPLQIPTSNAAYNILDGSCSNIILAPGQACNAAINYGAAFGPGASWAQSGNEDRQVVANMHFALPHRSNPGRDDLQLLYTTGSIFTGYYSSASDIGLTCSAGGMVSYACFAGDAQPFYLDANMAAGGGIYSGMLMQVPNASLLVSAPFPNSPANRTPLSLIPTSQRDSGSNSYAIVKAQYQRNFNDRSYLRVLGYGDYTNWFLDGANSAFNLFGATLPDYEVLGHIYGGSLSYANALSDKHLLTASLSYQTQKLQTYNATFDTVLSANPHLFVENTGQFGNVAADYTDGSHCYDIETGDYTSCYSLIAPNPATGNPAGSVATPNGPGGFSPAPGYLARCGFPGAPPACAASPRFLVTENGANAQVDNVTPHFSSFAITDSYRPNERLTVNAGARFDHFSYALDDLATKYPARAFWFNAYNDEHCSAPGVDDVLGAIDPATSVVSCPPGYTWMGTPGNGLINSTGGIVSQNVFSPRIAATYLLTQSTVLRGSIGVYTRPAATSYHEYNTYQQDLPSFIRQFSALGYRSPDHDVRADTSLNADFSYEHRFPKSPISLKVTPFDRTTRHQLQFLSISALGGILAGINVGTLHSYGVELAVQAGNFENDGLSAQFSYTHTNTHTRYNALSNGLNVIDVLNRSIEQYNSYTSACAANENARQCGSGLYAANGAVSFNGGTVPNPYFASALQPLMDANGTYVPYDLIPSAFASANSYAVPNVASLVINWKHKALTITPSFTYNGGSFYGSPLAVPGYVPQACTAAPSATPATPGVSCGSGGAIFVPDPYTGKFDGLGSLREPWQITGNLQIAYAFNSRMKLTLVGNNLYNRCWQRGYAWDTPTTCWYSSLPSNAIAPNGPGSQPGAFLTSPPIQLAYPYGTWFNNTQVGITSAVQPMQLTLEFSIQL